MSRKQLWFKRIGGLLATWLVLTAIFSWLYMDPSWPGMLALIVALFALGWLVQDYSDDLDGVVWTNHQTVAGRRPPVDGRMGYLRRIVTQSYEVAQPGSVKSRGAEELQEILQAVTARRLRSQHAAAPDEKPTDVIRRLAEHTDSRLVTYLLSNPPPTLTEAQLHDLLTRIEDL